MRTLSSNELRDFGRFLEGTSYRKGSLLFKLFELLKKEHPEFSEKKIEKERVYQKITGTKKAIGRRFFDLVSILNAQLESFLLLQHLENDKNEYEFLMLKVLRKRKLDRLYFNRIRSLEKSWKTERPSGLIQFHNEFALLRDQIFHPNYLLFYEDVDLTKLLEKLDQYYIVNKLYLTSCQQSLGKMIKPNEEAELETELLISEILKKSEYDRFAALPEISIFAKILNAYQSNDYSAYKVLKEEVFSNLDLFDQYERFDLFVFLQHFCIANHRQAKGNYVQELFELYDFSIKEKIAFEDGYISRLLFRTATAVACSAGQVEWAVNFVSENQQYLQEEFKEDTVCLAEGQIFFHQNSYEQAIDKLATVRFRDPVFGIQARSLLLQCYFEVDDYYDQFVNLIRSFRAFIDRNNVLPENATLPARNFIDYAEKMMAIKSDPNKSLGGMAEEIEGLHVISNKTWLMAKLQELTHK